MATSSQLCAKCRAPIADDAVFCSKCGQNVTMEHARLTLSDMGAVARPATVTPATADAKEGAGATDAPVSRTMARLRGVLGDRYDVVREIGQGGMATVYLARDLKHDRDVAIKVLHPDLAASVGGERFMREIHLAGKLQHPNILGMYDSGTDGDLMYYIMPFVKGESLRDRLDREKMLPIDDALRIIIEVADALGHAHSLGIIHRDIKPENVLLAGGHALVADFGIASAVSDDGGAKLTKTGMAIGTPVYMAPEQGSGEGVGPTADIYSLGCMLYEMLAGEPPFTGSSPMAIVARHLMEQVPSVRIVRDAVPEEVEETIFRSMEKTPVDRPQTAQQFVELLTEMQGLSMGGTATMRASRTTRTMRRPTMTMPVPVAVPWWRRGPVLAAFGALLVAGAGGVWYATRPAAAPAGGAALLDASARRLAVLYFDAPGGDSTLAAVADGLTEGLIRSLGTSPSLTVISKFGVAPFRDASASVDSIARALRVGYVVRGDVEREGERVRLAVRLDDASGVNLRRETLDVSRDSLRSLQDSLTTRVGALVREQLGEDLRLREMRAASANEAAWLLTQRGAQARRQGDALLGDGKRQAAFAEYAAADSLFALSEAADPRWVEPVTRRAELAYWKSRRAESTDEMRALVDEGLGHAGRALALDGADADALEARGTLLYWSLLAQLVTDPDERRERLVQAKSDLEAATRANRLQASAFASLSHLYYNDPTSTTSDVLLAAQRAFEADEFLENANVVLGRLFNAAYDLAQFDRARQYCDALRERFREQERAWRCELYLASRPQVEPTDADIARAWMLVDTLVAVSRPDDRVLERRFGEVLAAGVIARAAARQPALADSARAVLRRNESDATIDPLREVSLNRAYVLAILGDEREALQALTAYFAANPDAAENYANEPGWWFRSLAETTAFRQLVGRRD